MVTQQGLNSIDCSSLSSKVVLKEGWMLSMVGGLLYNIAYILKTIAGSLFSGERVSFLKAQG